MNPSDCDNQGRSRTTAIEISDVAFSYPRSDFSLRVARLTIDPGCRAAVIGPSGSGKTTLLNLIAGIRSPDRGRIVVGDTEVTGLGQTARRRFRIRNVGLVFQDFELLEYLTVLDNVLLPYRISSAVALSSKTRARAEALAAEVGIADKLRRNARRLSHGERQRVAVCRALLIEPRLLLADEPTGNLDPANKGRVLDILLDYTRRTGSTMLMVTHDHDLLDGFDRVIDCRDFQHHPASADAETAGVQP